jgi:hypothetical protein
VSVSSTVVKSPIHRMNVRRSTGVNTEYILKN